MTRTDGEDGGPMLEVHRRMTGCCGRKGMQALSRRWFLRAREIRRAISDGHRDSGQGTGDATAKSPDDVGPDERAPCCGM
jgi:hypothetical protein